MKILAGLILVLSLSSMGAPAFCQGTESAPDAHSQLDQIMKKPLYQRWKLRQDRASDRREFELTAGMKEWINGILEDTVDWIRSLFPSGSSTPGGTPWGPSSWDVGMVIRTLGWILLAVAIAVLVILFVRGFNKSRRSGAVAQILSRDQVHRALVEGEALAMDGSGWLSQVSRLAQDRDFRMVYRALYLALLSGLHKSKKIRFRKTRTNWTYVNGYKGAAEERPIFAHLTSIFDEIWYGHKPAPATSIDEVRGQVEHLLETELPRD